jgi:hypothetical protein
MFWALAVQDVLTILFRAVGQELAMVSMRQSTALSTPRERQASARELLMQAVPPGSASPQEGLYGKLSS